MTNETVKRQENPFMEIDVMELLQLFWKKIWLILLAAVICAGAVFAYTSYTTVPLYQSSAKMYVNNNDSLIGAGLSVSGVYSAPSLIPTYLEILYTRSTLERVIEAGDLTDDAGNPMSYGALRGKISAYSLNQTAIFQINVVDTDPNRAMLIANTITEVLPVQITSIIDGSSARVVDLAIKGTRISSGNTKNTIIGFFVGALIVCAIEFIRYLTDHYIHDENYILNNYDIPLLAVIPDLSTKSGKKYGKYKKSSKYGYSKYGKYTKYGYRTYGQSHSSSDKK